MAGGPEREPETLKREGSGKNGGRGIGMARVLIICNVFCLGTKLAAHFSKQLNASKFKNGYHLMVSACPQKGTEP